MPTENIMTARIPSGLGAPKDMIVIGVEFAERPDIILYVPSVELADGLAACMSGRTAAGPALDTPSSVPSVVRPRRSLQPTTHHARHGRRHACEPVPHDVGFRFSKAAAIMAQPFIDLTLPEAAGLFFCPVSSDEGALQADLEVHSGPDFVVDMPVSTSRKCHQLQTS